MLRYLNYQVYLTEIPDEISLGISILGCNVHCPYCHSKHTWDINSIGEGKNLNYNALSNMIKSQSGISCVLFFGGEWQPFSLRCNLQTVDGYDLKRALYTGRSLDYVKNNGLLPFLDYVKVGPYNATLGGLRSKTTNQRLYTVENGEIKEDITSKFWSKNV